MYTKEQLPFIHLNDGLPCHAEPSAAAHAATDAAGDDATDSATTVEPNDGAAAQRLAVVEAVAEAAHVALDAARQAVADARRGGASVQHLDGSTASAKQVLEALRRDGCVAVESLASEATMHALAGELAELDRFAYAGEPGSFAGANTRRNGSYVVAACPTAQELSIHPLLLAVVVATGGGVTRTPLIILHS